MYITLNMKLVVVFCLIFIGHVFCTSAAPECFNYSFLNETKRRYSYRGRGPGYADGSLIPGWYRFQSVGYTRMIDKCISHHRCGGSISGWLEGGHPSLAYGIVERKVCFHGFYKCCYKNRKIRVRECYGFYVYELKASPGNGYVYCTT